MAGDSYEPMSYQERQRELFGHPDPTPVGPSPPDSLTRDVEKEVALVYFRAAHEAARQEFRHVQMVRDGNSAMVEEVAMYGNLAESHLKKYREEKPDDLHRGGIRR